MKLEQQLEAILFFKGEPVSMRELEKITEQNKDGIKTALSLLRDSLENRGLTLMIKEDEVALCTTPEAGALIEKVRREELSKDIGKAGLETLAIILYKGPLARSEIDYIRGVNSTFMLRNLLIRGLIERISNPKNKRVYLYKPTFELLSFLGISTIGELPDFDKTKEELESFLEEEPKKDPLETIPTED